MGAKGPFIFLRAGDESPRGPQSTILTALVKKTIIVLRSFMKNIAPELIEILRYLLPGFLMAWVFHGLTPYPKGSEFERTIEALVFNLPIQIFASMERAIAQGLGRYLSLGDWSKGSDLA